MGHHFVPQAHLRRFECPERPGFVWMFDKVRRAFSQVSIKRAAQAREYYDKEVEAGLAETVEGPANQVVEKIRQSEELDNSERTHVSLYLLTMATRGPRQRRMTLEEIAPQAMESVSREIEADIKAWIAESNGDPEAIARLKELEEVREKFAETPPENITRKARTPFWSDATVECVHNMVWRVLPACPKSFFVTSDTPTHFWGSAGVGTPESEMTFPIARDVALIGSHTGRPATIEYVPPQTGLADEVNRRMVSDAERFVFSHVKEDWIAEWAENPPGLNKIEWI